MSKRKFQEISGYRYYKDPVQIKKIKLVHKHSPNNNIFYKLYEKIKWNTFFI